MPDSLVGSTLVHAPACDDGILLRSCRFQGIVSDCNPEQGEEAPEDALHGRGHAQADTDISFLTGHAFHGYQGAVRRAPCRTQPGQPHGCGELRSSVGQGAAPGDEDGHGTQRPSELGCETGCSLLRGPAPCGPSLTCGHALGIDGADITPGREHLHAPPERRSARAGGYEMSLQCRQKIADLIGART